MTKAMADDVSVLNFMMDFNKYNKTRNSIRMVDFIQFCLVRIGLRYQTLRRRMDIQLDVMQRIGALYNQVTEVEKMKNLNLTVVRQVEEKLMN